MSKSEVIGKSIGFDCDTTKRLIVCLMAVTDETHVILG